MTEAVRIKGDFGSLIKCPCCGKTFYRPAFEWRYNISYAGIHTKVFLCSYGCVNKYRKVIAEKGGGKQYMLTKAKSKENTYMLKALTADPGETHSLKEWADIYGIDYYNLWEAKVISRMSMIDALYMLVTSKEAM